MQYNELTAGSCKLPDKRAHRGPHPEDHALFNQRAVPDLRRATQDLSWLLTRGYASKSSLKLVGDRYALVSRQRVGVARCACSDQQLARRLKHQAPLAAVQNQTLWIDTFNVLTSVEAALSGGVILVARDGCYRDMASMHGSYKKVEETVPALQLLGNLMADWQIGRCHWLLDQPVSNSGRLKTILGDVAEANGWNWHGELVPDPDPILSRSPHLVVSSDSQILDQADRWFNLARTAIDAGVSDAWRVDVSTVPAVPGDEVLVTDTRTAE